MKRSETVIKIFVQGTEPLHMYSKSIHNVIGSIKNWANLKIFNPDESIKTLEKYTKDLINMHYPKYVTIIGCGIGAFYGYNIAAKCGVRFIGINPIMNPTKEDIKNTSKHDVRDIFKYCYINPQQRFNTTKAVYEKNFTPNVDLNNYYDKVEII